MGGGLYYLLFNSPPRASGTVSSVCLLGVGEPVAEDSLYGCADESVPG
jgi:hypothetical protein